MLLLALLLTCIPDCFKARRSKLRGRPLAVCVLSCVVGCLLSPTAATAADPVIVLNNSTGSDTAASGAPSTFTAVSAAATCHTNGASSTTIQWPANGIAGLPTDGSAALWLATSSGRRWSKVSAFDANTVTVEDAFNIAAGSPVDCAVGGKRATITAPQLFADPKVNWIVELENTGTNYTSGSTITCSSGDHFLVRGNQASPRPIIEGTADGVLFTDSNCDWQDLRFINSNASKTASIALNSTSGDHFIQNCIFGGASGQGFFLGISYNGIGVWRSEFSFNVTAIQVGGAARGGPGVLWNYIHTNTVGVQMRGLAGANAQRGLWRNVIVGNTGDGIQIITRPGPNWIVENVIANNGGDGVDAGDNAGGLSLVNNQITGNTGFGVTCSMASNCSWEGQMGVVDFNNYSGNGAGARNNLIAGPHDTANAPSYAGGTNFCSGAAAAGGPPGNGATIAGSATPSTLLQGACQPAGGGAGPNIGI